MTRHRKGIRPLSQTGFIRLPSNPHQRNFGEGGVKKKAVKVLEDFNEGQDTRQLHPTKGFRRLNVRRSRAQMLMAEIFQGHGRNTRLQSRFLQLGF